MCWVESDDLSAVLAQRFPEWFAHSAGLSRHPTAISAENDLIVGTMTMLGRLIARIECVPVALDRNRLAGHTANGATLTQLGESRQAAICGPLVKKRCIHAVKRDN